MQRPLRRSRSFKVTDFGTNRKPIYDFLLVINTNLRPTLAICDERSQMAKVPPFPSYGQIFASERGVPHFNAIAWGDPLPISP